VRDIRQLIHTNLPDAVWSGLKTYAQSQAQLQGTATFDECAAHVERIAREITGHANALRPDVVSFYAAETLEMIARYRSQEDGLAGGDLQSAV